MKRKSAHKIILGTLATAVFAAIITGIILHLPAANLSNGIWRGTFDISGEGEHDFTALYMEGKVIATSRSANVLYRGKVSADNHRYHSFLEMYIINKGLFDDAELNGIFLQADTIEAHYLTNAGRDKGKLTLSYQKSLFEQPANLNQLNGEWILYNMFKIFKIRITDGLIRGADNSGCSYEGKINIIDPQYNAYEVHMVVASCDDLNMELSGMAYVSSELKKDDTFNMYLFTDDWSMYLPIVRNDDTRLIDKNKTWGPPGVF